MLEHEMMRAIRFAIQMCVYQTNSHVYCTIQWAVLAFNLLAVNRELPVNELINVISTRVNFIETTRIWITHLKRVESQLIDLIE